MDEILDGEAGGAAGSNERAEDFPVLHFILLCGFAFLLAVFTLDGPDDYRYDALATVIVFSLFLFFALLAELVGCLFPAHRRKYYANGVDSGFFYRIIRAATYGGGIMLVFGSIAQLAGSN